jgi:shikimate kinase
MGNIYLVGFMGVGKTTVGKLLSKRLNRRFVEMDEEIENREGKKISEIFAQYGEPYFRKLEKGLLRELSRQNNLVVSCGGGVVCDEENLRILRETGLVFNLKAEPTTIYERTKKYTHRPLLNVEDPLRRIEELLKERSRFYSKAHYSINTDGVFPEEIVDKIVGILNK